MTKISGITNPTVLAIWVAKSCIHSNGIQAIGCGEIMEEFFFHDPLTDERYFAFDIEGSNGNGPSWANSDHPWMEDDRPKARKFSLRYVKSLKWDEYYRLARLVLSWKRRTCRFKNGRRY